MTERRSRRQQRPERLLGQAQCAALLSRCQPVATSLTGCSSVGDGTDGQRAYAGTAARQPQALHGALFTTACAAANGDELVAFACVTYAVCSLIYGITASSCCQPCAPHPLPFAASNTSSLTLGGGSVVNSWNDLSGNGNHFSVTTGSWLSGSTTAPVFQPTGNNGDPSVYFAAGNGLMCNNRLTLSATTGWSTYVVARLPDLTSNSRAFMVSAVQCACQCTALWRR